MSDSEHDLVSEFPEFRDKIHDLKVTDGHFRALFERYHEVNKLVMAAEHRTQPMSEEEEGKLRKERMQLKDDLYSILTTESS
ncbi:MAG: DUF465 domain-containing protein [Bdellovibrionales bacterium]|nr:DUF465 domain-containing protein [Bdellovibrionales bacterium]